MNTSISRRILHLQCLNVISINHVTTSKWLLARTDQGNEVSLDSRPQLQRLIDDNIFFSSRSTIRVRRESVENLVDFLCPCPSLSPCDRRMRLLPWFSSFEASGWPCFIAKPQNLPNLHVPVTTQSTHSLVALQINNNVRAILPRDMKALWRHNASKRGLGANGRPLFRRVVNVTPTRGNGLAQRRR